MIKRIVMVVGGVETLEYFSFQMGKTFEKEGYPVYYYDLKNEAESTRRLRKFVRIRETVLITFNFEGLSKESGVYSETRGYIWDEYQMPCFNIAVDHPYYYHKRLEDLPDKYYHISIDKNHVKYFERFYPEYNHAGFLPLAGTVLQEEEAQGDGAEADIDVILTGNYTPLSFSEKYIHRMNGEYAAFYQGIIDELIEHPDRTLEDVAAAHCKEELGDISDGDFRLVMHNMIFIDLYIRSYWRGQVVKTLVDAGVVVDVFGKGWEELKCQRPENLHIHPMTTSLVCLQQIKRAKVSLNVMPWFKDGVHDRVFNSILNGTVSVTDKSRYLCQELPEGQGVCYYDLENLDKLPELVDELLKKPDKRQGIVENGMDKARTCHTWESRARQIIDYFIDM